MRGRFYLSLPFRPQCIILLLFLYSGLGACSAQPKSLRDYGWQDPPKIHVGMGPIGSKTSGKQLEAEIRFICLAVEHGRPFIDAIACDILRETDPDKQFLLILKLCLLQWAKPCALFIKREWDELDLEKLSYFDEKVSPYVSQRLVDIACDQRLASPDLVDWILHDLLYRQRNGFLGNALVGRLKMIKTLQADSKLLGHPEIAKAAEDLASAVSDSKHLQ